MYKFNMSQPNDPKSVSNQHVSVHEWQPNRILEGQNEDLNSEQFENSNEESSVGHIELLEDLNEDLSVEFEAFKVKNEIELITNPESHQVEYLENNEGESEPVWCSFVSADEWSPEEAISECDPNVSGKNTSSSANLWILSKTPIYLQPKERFRCPFIQCSHISLHYTHLKAHIIVAHDDPFKIPCRYCDVIFNEMPDFHKHLKLHGPQLYKCSYCSYYNYIEYTVKGHCVSVHAGLPQTRREIRNELETTCEQPNSLNLSELSGNIACNCCNNFHCFSDNSLRKHIIQCLSLTNYTCNLCDKEFSKATEIEVHFQNYHAESIPYFTVSLKPKVEARLNNLVDEQVAKSRRQMQLPSVSMPRTPGTSGVITTSMADYSNQAMCPYCNYISHRSHVMDHVFIHYETKFFSCIYCPMENRHKGTLRQHISAKHPKQTLAYFIKPVPANLVLRNAVIIVTQLEASSSNEKEDYMCNKCAFSTSSLNNIRYHCQNEHELASSILFGKGYLGTIGNNKRKTPVPNRENVINTDTVDDDSRSRYPCMELEVLDNISNWLLHFRANHIEESKALKPPAKKRKLSNTAPDWLEDNNNEKKNEKLKAKSAASKSNDKYSLALQCSYCDFVAVVVKNITAHCNAKHYNRKLAYTSINIIAAYQCLSCLFKTPNAEEARKHIRDKHCFKFSCNKCAKIFITAAAAKLHYRYKHPGERRQISRKSIDKHHYQVLVAAMMASNDDKLVKSSSKNQLMVNMNLENCQNVSISYEHLCEIFNFNVCVLIKDLKHCIMDI